MGEPKVLGSPLALKRSLAESVPRPLKRRRTEDEDAAIPVAHAAEQRGTDEVLIPESAFDMVAESMFRSESSCSSTPGRTDQPSQIDSAVRAGLITCLMRLQHNFQLSWSTLFLTVNLLDRYLEKVPVKRSQMQLIGVTSVLVASKFNETDPPTVADLVDSTNNACRAEDIIRFQIVFLQTLNFSLVCTTADQFLVRLQQLCGAGDSECSLSGYLLELTLLDERFVGVPASKVAAATMLLARTVLQKQPGWSEEAEAIARYSRVDLEGCVSDILTCVAAVQPRCLHAVRRRYVSTKDFASWLGKLSEYEKVLRSEMLCTPIRKSTRMHVSASPMEPNSVTPPVLKTAAPVQPTSEGNDQQIDNASQSACSGQRPKCKVSAVSLCELRCECHGCDEHRVGVHRQAFEGMLRSNKGKLTDMCKAKRVASTGTKEEIALRLIDAMFH